MLKLISVQLFWIDVGVMRKSLTWNYFLSTSLRRKLNLSKKEIAKLLLCVTSWKISLLIFSLAHTIFLFSLSLAHRTKRCRQNSWKMISTIHADLMKFLTSSQHQKSRRMETVSSMNNLNRKSFRDEAKYDFY